MGHGRLYMVVPCAVCLLLVQLYLQPNPNVDRKNNEERNEATGVVADQLPADSDVHTGNTNVTQSNFEQYSLSSKRKKTVKHITVDFMGRLGNLMFEFASLYGIARKNNLIPVVPTTLNLLKHFNIQTETHLNARRFRAMSKQYHEKKGCTFEPEVMTLGGRSDVTLNGYFQSWKYFYFVDEEIRANFHWRESVLDDARRQFDDVIESSRPRHFIGVHVRRGDMVYSAHMTKYGYISPDKGYLENAMNHFREKYKDVLFIVVSDEIEWCFENIDNDDVRFVKTKNSASVDMAILTMCNHTVMTSGSYGWWSAWLAGGDVIYFKGYPRPNSTLYDLVTPEDYRPPSWIGM